MVELVALEDAEIKYSTVQNWYPGDAEGRGGFVVVDRFDPLDLDEMVARAEGAELAAPALQGPLAEDAGGWGLCTNEAGKPVQATLPGRRYINHC